MSNLAIGIVGLGGFAGIVCDRFLSHWAEPDLPRLVAACDPNLQANLERAGRLSEHGVTVLDSFDRLLEHPLDAVWLPVPIHLHRAFTERALRAGKAVLVEKPAASCVADVDMMIAARDASGLPVAVGFQNLFDPAAWQAKQAILDGIIGEVTDASIYGCWPRSEEYYTRTAWAGRRIHNGQLVLDSPANNAMAHFINLGLFLLGTQACESANIASMEAELYRTNAIENYDTCSVRAISATGVRISVGLTHASRTEVTPIVRINGTQGAVQFEDGVRFDVFSKSGSLVRSFESSPQLFKAVLRGFADYVAGKPDAQYASLENARAHTRFVEAASHVGNIREVPSSFVTSFVGNTGSTSHAIFDIENALQNATARGRLLSETGLLQWA